MTVADLKVIMEGGDKGRYYESTFKMSIHNN